MGRRKVAERKAAGATAEIGMVKSVGEAAEADRNAWRRARGCTCGAPEGEPHDDECPRLKALLDEEHVTDGQPCPCEPEVSSQPEKPQRISGEELAGRLRQERRENRLKEKGY